MLKGTTILLHKFTYTEWNAFGEASQPIEEVTVIEDCLVAPSTAQDMEESMNLFGKRATYVLALPKGNADNFTNNEVEWLGHRFKVVGTPIEGVEANVPTRWHRKVYLEELNVK